MNPSSTTNMVNQSQLKRRGIQTRRSTHTCKKKRRRSLPAGRRGNWRRGVTGWRGETTRPGPIRTSTFKRKLQSGRLSMYISPKDSFALYWGDKDNWITHVQYSIVVYGIMKLQSVTINWTTQVHFS